MRTNTRRTLLAAVAAAALGGALALPAATAHAAPAAAHAVTHVTSRADSGNGGTWAYDTFNRTLDVRVAPSQSGAPAGDTLYVATVKDSGSFTARQGELTPNQVTAGLKITHAVKGTLTGGISYTITAPSADTLTGVVPKTENDAFGPGLVTTGNWPAQAFATAAGVTVTEGSTWSWRYATQCEAWTDSAANGDGNHAGDGNITGRICPVPFVFGGHVITVNNNDATVGWSTSPAGWPSPASKCVEVREFGYGFTVNGSPHVGFTCAKVGYLSGMAAGHTYFLQVVPAVGTYASHHQIPGTDVHGGIDVVTTRV
jgi:hypothetical protein